MLIDYHLAELILQSSASDRKDVLRQAREQFERFLSLLDTYGILSKGDRKLHEQYLDAPNSFSTISTTDAALRRESKIARFREEKGLKKKLEVCRGSDRSRAILSTEAGCSTLTRTQPRCRTTMRSYVRFT